MDLHERQLEPVARGAENVPDTFSVRGIRIRIVGAVEGSSVHVQGTPTGCNEKETEEGMKRPNGENTLEESECLLPRENN